MTTMDIVIPKLPSIEEIQNSLRFSSDKDITRKTADTLEAAILRGEEYMEVLRGFRMSNQGICRHGGTYQKSGVDYCSYCDKCMTQGH